MSISSPLFITVSLFASKEWHYPRYLAPDSKSGNKYFIPDDASDGPTANAIRDSGIDGLAGRVKKNRSEFTFWRF